MSTKIFDVASPVNLPNGKTAWVSVGRAFQGSDDSKYCMKLSISSLPLSTFQGGVLELFVFVKAGSDEKSAKKTNFKADPDFPF